MKLSFWVNGKEYKLNLRERAEGDIQVTWEKKSFRVFVEHLCPDEILLNIDGKIYDVFIESNALTYSVGVNGRFFQVEKKSVSQILGSKQERQRKREIKTSMPGKIVKVLVEKGDSVKEGQAVLILEAMKMQNEIKAPQSGKISHLGVKPGASVETNSLLFTVE
jgi:biotin carboxyl carrier protein